MSDVDDWTNLVALEEAEDGRGSREEGVTQFSGAGKFTILSLLVLLPRYQSAGSNDLLLKPQALVGLDWFTFSVYRINRLLADKATFGLLFDIDGVLVRSNRVLPDVRETFLRLVDSNKKFRVPTVFVTNAGNKLRQQKASQLTNWLGVEVSEEQVVMAHSPLSLFTPFHNKHALLSGQGPVVDIAKDLGFTNVTTMETLRDTFPSLDAVNHERYNPAPSALGPYFKPVEVVVLFGEPVRWETSLQLLIDILMTNGLPNNAPNEIIYPHIPVLACNMDLQWMAAACMPRFGHGAFLICLENLYKKITEKDLIYTALIGKPSEITYHHAHQLIMKQAKEIGVADEMKTLYAI
ncbi:hypothetical protein J437_LFUL005516, partial [Ladona fulva]